MEPEFWHQRWRTGQIGFHNDAIHWALKQHWQDLGVDSNEPVLVPLSGKTLDMRWLRSQGHPVTGVELDPIAVGDFFTEWGRTPRSVAPLTRHELSGFEADGICLWQGDFFAYRNDHPFQAFYDRAALIALPADMRIRYMQQLRDCLAPSGIGLLVTLEYDQKQKDGPPFSVLMEEVSGFCGFRSELLERRDVLDESPKFKHRGVTSLHETVYRLHVN